jgi:hypothetical protein
MFMARVRLVCVRGGPNVSGEALLHRLVGVLLPRRPRLGGLGLGPGLGLGLAHQLDRALDAPAETELLVSATRCDDSD